MAGAQDAGGKWWRVALEEEQCVFNGPETPCTSLLLRPHLLEVFSRIMTYFLFAFGN